ncbi:MAG: hypothetical protein GF417_10100 [Candidatus Latescibacteria bacterium]|nr:hypothetical protein [bacterium]MBD3424778.1 hypothetical protein [Candidatus Latescibacterota bacterium]
MSVKNLTRHTMLGHTLLTLSRNFPRTLKHINQFGIPEGYALWISPCSAIYTVGMNNPVDIVFLDKDRRIIKILRNFPPSCFARTDSESIGALELPPNRLAQTNSFLGDRIKLEID